MKKILFLAGLVLVALFLVFESRIQLYFGKEKCADARWVQDDGSCKPPQAATTPIPTASLPSDSAEVRAQIAKLEREKQELAAKLTECERLCPKIAPCAPVAKVAPKPKPKPKLAPAVEWTDCPGGGHVRKGQKCPPPASARVAASAPTPEPQAKVRGDGERLPANVTGTPVLHASVKNTLGVFQPNIPMTIKFMNNSGIVLETRLVKTDANGRIDVAFAPVATCIRIYFDTSMDEWLVRPIKFDERGNVTRREIFDYGYKACVSGNPENVTINPFTIADKPYGKDPALRIIRH